MLHRRKKLRVKEIDYRDGGFYFVTICTQDRQHLFGRIVGTSLVVAHGNDTTQKRMVLNDAGKMIESVWKQLPARFPCIALDAFVVMPDHVHGILEITGAGTRPAPSLGDVVGAFKSITTHEYIVGVRNCGWPGFRKRLWQRNYYERVVKSKDELDKTRT